MVTIFVLFVKFLGVVLIGFAFGLGFITALVIKDLIYSWVEGCLGER